LRSRIGSKLLYAGCLLLPIIGGSLWAQPQDQDHEWGPYAVQGSIGVSGVLVDINGSESLYRTHYNYRDGFHLSEFRLDLFSESGTSDWMDFFQLDGSGFGGAMPHERATLQFGKRGVYEFRGNYRKQIYFFDLPSFALGAHTSDSARRSTDLNLRLFLHRRFTLELGYFRNRSYGTSFSSQFQFQDLFQIADPRRTLTQDFRIGGTFDFDQLRFSVFQNFRKYKDDPEQAENLPIGEARPADIASSVPVRLSIPSTHLVASFSPSSRFSIDGKYLYSDGHAESNRAETLALQLTEGLTLEQIVHASSVSDRPEHLGEIGLFAGLTDRVAFKNVFEIRRFDLQGQFAATTSLGVPGQPGPEFLQEAEQVLEYRLVRNRPEIEFYLDPRLTLYGGYQFEDRQVDRVFGLSTDTENEVLSHSRRSHSGFGGVAWRPYSRARVSAELEIGSADDSFTPTEPDDFLRWRIQARLPLSEGLTLTPRLLISDRNNKSSGTNFDLNQRQVGIDLVFRDPDQRFDISGGYNLFHLVSLADISFFLSQEPALDRSRYRTNLHHVYARAGIPTGIVRLRFGFQLLKDPDSSTLALDRHHVEAGFSVPFAEVWSWDTTWYYVNYEEQVRTDNEYSANRLVLTLRWRF